MRGDRVTAARAGNRRATRPTPHVAAKAILLWLHIAEMRRQLIPRDEETRSAGRRHWHGADALVRHGGAQRAIWPSAAKSCRGASVSREMAEGEYPTILPAEVQQQLQQRETEIAEHAAVLVPGPTLVALPL